MTVIYALSLIICLMTPSSWATGGDELTPPFSNVMEFAQFKSTSTCGDQGPEEFCNLVALDSQEQCSVCDKTSKTNYHPPESIGDGSSSFWMSAPLSRGELYENVNLTVDLGHEYEVGYVHITMGDAPAPAAWVLERSRDHGVTWTPWQYFADGVKKCRELFGDVDMKIRRDDSVICDAGHSDAFPLRGKEIFVSLLDGRPSWTQLHRPESPVFWEWMRATSVRLRFLKMHQLHFLYPIEEDDNRKFFYSVRHLSVGGRCACNGHARACDNSKNQISCKCEHQTCGSHCGACCPGYRAVPWRPARRLDPFECQWES